MVHQQKLQVLEVMSKFKDNILSTVVLVRERHMNVTPHRKGLFLSIHLGVLEVL